MNQVYFFGANQADGKSSDNKLLGGKGANLAEMTNIGLPQLGIRFKEPKMKKNNMNYKVS